MKINPKILLLALPLALTSCVSSKKFQLAETERINCLEREKNYLSTIEDMNSQVKALEYDTMRFGQRYRNLEADKLYLEQMSSKEISGLQRSLQQKEGELNEKERMLNERERKVQELQDAINKKDSVVNRLRNTVANALTGFRSDELTVEMKNGKVYVSLSENLLFKSGSSAVDAKGRDAIQKLADVLVKNPEIEIQIEGHTDSIPIRGSNRFEDNWDLSVLRATSIVRILQQGGIDSKRIMASGRGEYFPVAANTTAEGRARNRRTEIILSPKLDELFNLLESN